MEQLFSKLFNPDTLMKAPPAGKEQLVQAFKVIFTKYLQQQKDVAVQIALIKGAMTQTFQFLSNEFSMFKKVTKIVLGTDPFVTYQYLSVQNFAPLKEMVQSPPLKLAEENQVFENLLKFILPLQLVKRSLAVVTFFGQQPTDGSSPASPEMILLTQIIKQFISKSFSQKTIQAYLIDPDTKELQGSSSLGSPDVRKTVIRCLCKIMSANTTVIPISGIDMIKTLSTWFYSLEIDKSSKELKAFNNLLLVIASLGNLQGPQPNTVAIQFIIRFLQNLGTDKTNSASKVFMLLEKVGTSVQEHTFKQIILQSLKYIYQQQQTPGANNDTSQFDEKLYFRLLKLPLTRQACWILQCLLGYFLEQQNYQFLVYLTAKSLSVLATKLVKSPPQTRSNILQIMTFFMFGYQMQSKYFIDYCDIYLEVLNRCRDNLLPLKGSLSHLSQSEIQQEKAFTQNFIHFLEVCMSIHSGHPEKYGDIQDVIGELVYDYHFKTLSGAELDLLKTSSLWVSLVKQQEFATFENNQASLQATQEVVQVAEAKRFKGLLNLGNTCYMNSFLQALYQVKEFREDLLRLEDVAFKVQDQKTLSKVKLSIYQLQRLYAQLYASQRPHIAPRQFRVSLPDFFKNFEQHDCSEFAKLLLDKLEQEFKQCQVENLNNRYLEGIKVNRIECQECKNVSETKETIIDLGVNFDQPHHQQQQYDTQEQSQTHSYNLEQMIKESFQDEMFDGDNKYHCEKCGKQVELAVRRSRIERLPQYLIVTINRFYFDRQTFTKKKLLHPVGIQLSLTIDKSLFVDAREDSATSLEYELQSVVIHAGTNINFGHYYTVAKDQCDCQWRIFNDAQVTDIKDSSYLETIQKYAQKGFEAFIQIDYVCRKFAFDTPYIVIYKRKGEEFQGGSQQDDVTMKDESTSQIQPNEESKEAEDQQTKGTSEPEKFELPAHLKKFIEADNKVFLEEEKQKKDQKTFNYSFFKELQKQMAQMQSQSQQTAEDNLRRWYGGDFGGPSSGAGGFFGGSGFIM